MSAPASDRPAVASEYARQMRDGLRRIRAARSVELRQRLRLATRRAVLGVLRYSNEPADVKVAREVLEMLEVERHSDRLRRDTAELRAEGATITDRHIASAATRLGAASATRELADADDRRRAEGLEGL